MKVVVISNFFLPDFVGGAEIYAYRLAKELVKMGIEIYVITSTKTGKRVIELDGMKIYQLTKAPPFLKITGNFLGYNFNPYSYRVNEVLNQIRPDIIHLHNIHSTFMLYPLTRFLNFPAIMHVHDHWPICHVGTLYNVKKNDYCDNECAECAFRPGFQAIGNINLRLRNKLVPQFERRIKLFITPSNYLREKLLEKNFTTPDKIIHIPLGIDLNEFLPGPDREFKNPTILFIGRLASYKNPALIVKILPKILKHIDCKFQVAGKGPEMEKVRDLSQQIGVEKNVEILGGISFSSLLNKIRQAGVLVVPSLWHENSPVVIYEAQACGLPVIVSSLGGPKELIEEGKTGFAIDPSDENGWIEKILHIIGNNDIRRRMGVEARKKAEREFDIKDNAKNMLNIYEQVINR